MPNTVREFSPAPEAVYLLYLSCVKKHNRPEGVPGQRRDISIRAAAILDVVRVVWGSAQAGDIIYRGDMAAGCMDHDRPMRGGLLMDLDA